MAIVNATPHPVMVVDKDGNVLHTLQPRAAGPVRLKSWTERVAEIDGVPTSKTVFGEVENLEEEVEGVYYIVSQLVKSALPIRADLLVPAEVLRDKEGKILGCQSLGV